MKLTRLQRRDSVLLTKWLFKDYVKHFFGDPLDWLTEIMENIDDSDWVKYYLISDDKIPIGFAQVYDCSRAPKGLWSKEPQKTLGIDFMIGEENYLGRGFGCDIVNLLIKEIKGQKKFKKIVADPDSENIASIRSLEKNGFVLQRSGLYGLEI